MNSAICKDDILEVRLETLDPITDDGSVTINATAIVLNNAGTAAVTINNNFTIAAGGSLQFSVTDERRSILVAPLKIKFGTGTKNLQVLILEPSHGAFSNYSPR